MFVILLATAITAGANGASARSPAPGDRYEIVRETSSAEQSSRDNSGATHDRDSYLLRILASRENGFELEYDLPAKTSAEDRARTWQFPVRVFQPRNGPLQLLNASELNDRITKWLAAGKLPRSACGHWVFTWNAFKVECDPQSVLGALEALRLPLTPVAVGDTYILPGTGSSGVIKNKDGTLATSMQVNPDAIRREAAESDLVVGEIMQKPVTFTAALLARSNDQISGTMTIMLSVDGGGIVTHQAIHSRIKTRKPNGEITIRTVDDEIDRRLLADDR
ncbi:hypothetical protein SPAN111604_07145 [Sphingomonas antarctica]